MKKKLLLLFTLTISYCIQAQDVILTEDCSALTVGNIGTVNIAATPNPDTDIAGQGGWKPFCNVATADSDFQVLNMGGTYGNAFQITGSSNAAGNRRLYKDFSTAWTNRTAGQDITELVVDLFTGPNDGTENNSRIYIYDSAKSLIVGGFYFDKTATETTSVNFSLRGILRTTTTPVGSITSVKLLVDNSDPANPVASDLILDENTWYTLGVGVDYINDKIVYSVTKKSDNSLLANTYLEGSQNLGTTAAPAYLVTAGNNLGFVEFTNHAGADNTWSSTVTYDNLIIKSTTTDTLLLGTKQNTLLENKLTISPNPSSDIIRVTNSENISVSEIAILDLNGRVIKITSYNDASNNIQVNVSDLVSGIYLMKIASDKGIATKKIVKN